MKTAKTGIVVTTVLALAASAAGWAADDTVATAVYGRVGNGYKRVKLPDGHYKPEYYALTNGGQIFGTTSDASVARIPYEDVVRITRPLLAEKDYRFARKKEQVTLLIVLNWGVTLAPNGSQKEANVAASQVAMETLKGAQVDAKAVASQRYASEDVGTNTASGLGRGIQFATNEEIAVAHAANSVENQFLRGQVDDRVRDQLNEHNARVLGYMDELADSNDIRRYAGGGDRFNDLVTEVEEARYYIVISAYDFKELSRQQKKKLLWQTRVSVRSPGNTFDSTVAAMMKSASKYFGQDSGRLVRGEESRGTVELGDLKFLGEAKEAPVKTSTKEKK